MFNHSFHVRRALTGVVAGAIVAGALAGPAIASGGDDTSVRKAGEKPLEYLITPRKAGEKPLEYLVAPRKAGDKPVEYMRKADGGPSGFIILI